MKRRLLAAATLLMSLLLTTWLPSTGSMALAQEDDETSALTEPQILLRATIEQGEMPVAPAFVRLLRIHLEPGASSPLHTHPGPEFGLVETGTLTVQVNGVARLSRPEEPVAEGTPTPNEAPLNSEFEMSVGEQIYFIPQTPMTFRNGGSEPVTLFSAVILPAGHQHPPGITYLAGQPDAADFAGVTPEILGDGVATELPTGTSVLTVERVRYEPGEAIPAFDGPVLLSLDQGVFDFTVVGGKVQVSRTATPGPQPDSPPESEVTMSKGDAVFFPLGMAEVDRSGTEGDLVLLRMTIEATGDEADPTAVPDGVGVIAITAAEATPTAEATEAPAATPEADETPEPEEEETPTPEATETPEAITEIQEGATVVVTEDGVNVRAEPSLAGAPITQAFAGQLLLITGDSVEGEEYVWWPISFVDDPSITGYIVEDFIELVPEE